MDPVVAAHVLFVGLWGGLVFVEILFEVQMLRGRLDELAVAELHRLTDRFLELPLLVAVVASGWFLWQRGDYQAHLLPKVLFGLGAVLANVICYVFVERRATAARRMRLGQEEDAAPCKLRKLSWALVMTIAPGMLLGMAALYLGGRQIGWW